MHKGRFDNPIYRIPYKYNEITWDSTIECRKYGSAYDTPERQLCISLPYDRSRFKSRAGRQISYQYLRHAGHVIVDECVLAEMPHLVHLKTRLEARLTMRYNARLRRLDILLKGHTGQEILFSFEPGPPRGLFCDPSMDITSMFRNQ